MPSLRSMTNSISWGVLAGGCGGEGGGANIVAVFDFDFFFLLFAFFEAFFADDAGAGVAFAHGGVCAEARESGGLGGGCAGAGGAGGDGGGCCGCGLLGGSGGGGGGIAVEELVFVLVHCCGGGGAEGGGWARLGVGGHNKDVVAWRAVEPHGGTKIWRVGVLLGEL